MPRLIPLVIFAAAAIAGAGEPTTVEIVLDGSGAMHRPGPGGTPIHAMAREALIAVVTEAAVLEPELTIGMRVSGGGSADDVTESCSAPGSTVPIGAVDPLRWTQELDAIAPRGLRPLIGTVLAALADMKNVTGKRRIVVLTSGDDECGATPNQVAAALAAEDPPPELRMVGLGLEQNVIDRFGAVPTRNATTVEELLDALRWAVLGVEEAPRNTGVITLSFTDGPAERSAARASFIDMATGVIHTDTVTPGTRFDLPTGRYSLTIEAEDGGHHDFRDLLVVAQSERVVEIDLGSPPVVVVGMANESVVADVPTWIDVAGEPPLGSRVQFIDASGLAVTRVVDPNENDGWIATPVSAGIFELLLLSPGPNGVRRVITSREVSVGSADPTITVPDDLSAGDTLTVGYSGAPTVGDFIGLVPRGGSPEEVVSCATVGISSELRLTPPSTDVELDLIYVAAATMEILARQELKVESPSAVLRTRGRVSTGSPVVINWSGPENAEDFLSLAPLGSPDGDYIDWARTEEGNPTTFSAPQEPAIYQARYVDGETGKVLARARIEVVLIPIELLVPATATAGQRFRVEWTGPAAPGDYLSISNPGARPHLHHDWASTTIGSPLTLAAPSQPGTYEVRYVTERGREIVARATIEVRE